MVAAAVPEPRRVPIPDAWAHKRLHGRVQDALNAVPEYFRTTINIAGIPVTDIHTLSATLGAAIEQQVVQTLNSMRRVWDPDEEYSLYRFVRQSQTFPDVLLQSGTEQPGIIMGIELKGWYLLAKEGVGSFRFTSSPTACNPWDLIVVVPWALENVTAGEPKVFAPFIESARYAAEYRNYRWEHGMSGHIGDRRITLASAKPYPSKSDPIADKPVHDPGGNFGRLFRYGLMDDYLKVIRRQPVCGVEAILWQRFFRIIDEKQTEALKLSAIERLRDQIEIDAERVGNLSEKVVRIIEALEDD